LQSAGLVLLPRVVHVTEIGEILERLLCVEQRVERPQAEVPGQVEKPALVGDHRVVNIRAPGHDGTRGEEVDQLLGAEGVVLVLIVLFKDGREEVVALARDLDR
jgi:hypothetical protein